MIHFVKLSAMINTSVIRRLQVKGAGIEICKIPECKILKLKKV